MILSHQFKFLFVKTRKTAGTSMELGLAKYLGEQDVITHCGEDEALRQELGVRGPQHFNVPFSRYTAREWRHLLLGRKRCQYRNHTPADKIKRRIPAQVWRSYFKFCFVRNPWDRVVSKYYWHERKKAEKPPFPEWLAALTPDNVTNTDLYLIDGKIAVDQVYRFEDLKEVLAALPEQLGLPGPLELPRAKGNQRPQKRDYREYYTDETRAMVAEKAREEIELFGYEFGE